jgi:hypothetical protein
VIEATYFPLVAEVRRGSLASTARANGVSVYGDTVELAAFADGPATIRRGPTWLVVSGTHMYRQYEPGGGYAGADPIELIFGATQLADSCYLVWVARTEDAQYDIDTLAAVLASVRHGAR